MQDRVSELGVRKAFGASRKTLMGQVFWENMLLMLPGGMAGLLFSYVLVFVFRGILLSPGLYRMGSGAGNDIFLSPGMLLNMERLRLRVRCLRGAEPALFDDTRLAYRAGEYNGCVER